MIFFSFYLFPLSSLPTIFFSIYLYPLASLPTIFFSIYLFPLSSLPTIFFSIYLFPLSSLPTIFFSIYLFPLSSLPTIFFSICSPFLPFLPYSFFHPLFSSSKFTSYLTNYFFQPPSHISFSCPFFSSIPPVSSLHLPQLLFPPSSFLNLRMSPSPFLSPSSLF